MKLGKVSQALSRPYGHAVSCDYHLCPLTAAPLSVFSVQLVNTTVPSRSPVNTLTTPHSAQHGMPSLDSHFHGSLTSLTRRRNLLHCDSRPSWNLITRFDLIDKIDNILSKNLYGSSSCKLFRTLLTLFVWSAYFQYVYPSCFLWNVVMMSRSISW